MFNSGASSSSHELAFLNVRLLGKHRSFHYLEGWEESSGSCNYQVHSPFFLCKSIHSPHLPLMWRFPVPPIFLEKSPLPPRIFVLSTILNYNLLEQENVWSLYDLIYLILYRKKLRPRKDEWLVFWFTLISYFKNVFISNLQWNYKSSDNNFYIDFSSFASCLHFLYLLYPISPSLPSTIDRSIYHLHTYRPISHLPFLSLYLYLHTYILFILSMTPCYPCRLQRV